MDFFLAVLSSFAFSLVAIKVLRPFAIRFELVDKPCARKQHNGHVPLIGGIAVFCSVVLSSSIWLPVDVELVSYLSAAGLMVMLGVVDDKHSLSVRFRVGFQLLIATFMIVTIDSYLINLGNLFSFGDVNLGYFGLVVTYIAVVAMINAFNMVDGIDGLLGAMAINTMASIALLLTIKNQENLFTILIIFSLIPYLIFNLGVFGTRYRKIFMGDAGSMFIGFTVVWLLVINTQGENTGFRPVTALWIVAVPLLDMAAVILYRIRNGRSPFHADRQHLHHVLLRLGLSSRSTLLLIFLLSVAFSMVGIYGEQQAVSESVMFFSFLCLLIVYCAVLNNIWRINKFAKRLSLKIVRYSRQSKPIKKGNI
jgi:UDP-GlcNAc:undecaprenyl-phosphate GlcNAc-1-phosphate transferase